jgi:hypothetical protein
MGSHLSIKNVNGPLSFDPYYQEEGFSMFQMQADPYLSGEHVAR